MVTKNAIPGGPVAIPEKSLHLLCETDPSANFYDSLGLHLIAEVNTVTQVTGTPRYWGYEGNGSNAYLTSQHNLVWEYDGQNFIVNNGGTIGLVFVLGGIQLMQVKPTGEVLLPGSFIEETFSGNVVHSPDDSPNGEIEYNFANNSIAFAVESSGGGSWIRVAELRPDGNLYAYQFQEDSDYPVTETTFGGDYYKENNGDQLDFTDDLTETILRIKRTVPADTNGIIIADQFTEGALDL